MLRRIVYRRLEGETEIEKSVQERPKKKPRQNSHLMEMFDRRFAGGLIWVFADSRSSESYRLLEPCDLTDCVVLQPQL
jgi:hypothetical protein